MGFINHLITLGPHIVGSIGFQGRMNNFHNNNVRGTWNHQWNEIQRQNGPNCWTLGGLSCKLHTVWHFPDNFCSTTGQMTLIEILSTTKPHSHYVLVTWPDASDCFSAWNPPFMFEVSALLRGRGLSSFFICSMFFLSLGGVGGGDVNVLCDC